jgi:V/A-type H+-transporting ATPase subunit E
MADESAAVLEKELLARAERLAEEYRENGHATAEGIVHEAEERTRAREERELELARVAAERVYRQRVQAATLDFDAELERLRWTLIQEIIGSVRERLARFADDRAGYQRFLRACLTAAARDLGVPKLVAEMNSRDLKQLAGSFAELAHAAVPDADVELSREAIDCLGGVTVRSADETMRVDATFDGRIRRLERRLVETIMQRLFGSQSEKGALRG